MLSTNLFAAAILALAACTTAQTDGFDPILKPERDEVVPAGSTYSIQWQSTRSDKITLTLIAGPATDAFQKLSTIAAGIDSSLGKYAWRVDASLGAAAFYGVNLTLDSDPQGTFQYSARFHIKGSGAASNSSSSSSSSSSATTLSSATATATTPTASASATSDYITRLPGLITSTATTGSGSMSTAAITASILPVTNLTTTTTGTAPSATVSKAAAQHLAAQGAMGLIGGLAAALFVL